MPTRKRMRLDGWNYSGEGAYFLTLCARNRRPIFSNIVGRGILDAPLVELTRYGRIIHEALSFLSAKDPNIRLDKWVIMPNHVHLIVVIIDHAEIQGSSEVRSSATQTIPKLISSLKRYTNRVSGYDLWQDGYYDHIVRDEQDYLHRWQYIDNNPAAWLEDEYYHA